MKTILKLLLIIYNLKHLKTYCLMVWGTWLTKETSHKLTVKYNYYTKVIGYLTDCLREEYEKGDIKKIKEER